MDSVSSYSCVEKVDNGGISEGVSNPDDFSWTVTFVSGHPVIHDKDTSGSGRNALKSGSKASKHEGDDRWSVEDVNESYTNISAALFFKCFSPYKRPLRSRVDNIWNGLDALLIKSERGKLEYTDFPDNYRKHPDEVGAGKALKASVLANLIEGKNRGQVKMIAEAVALLTKAAIPIIDWKWLEEQLTSKTCQIVRDSVFRSVYNYILSVFEMDDFLRVYNKEMLIDEAELLFTDLHSVKSLCNPVMAIADGRFVLDKYRFLKEEDIADMLWQHQALYSKDPRWPATALAVPIVTYPVTQYEVRSAMRVLQTYRPLKEDYRTQLILEMCQGKCYHVTDALYLEAWKGIEIQELLGHVNEKCGTLQVFIETINLGLEGLGLMKEYMLQHSQRALLFPLRCGAFGPCTDEVLEVVKIANIERRMQGRHRFISLGHLLFSLLHSRIGQSVRRIICESELNCVCEEPQKVPLYYIYKLSQDVASFSGDKKMGIEHLFVAIFLEKQSLEWISILEDENGDLCLSYFLAPKKSLGVSTYLASDEKEGVAELLHSLRKSERKCDVKSWEDPFIWSKYLPKELVEGKRVKCTGLPLVKILNDAFKSGITLPDIRLEK